MRWGLGLLVVVLAACASGSQLQPEQQKAVACEAWRGIYADFEDREQLSAVSLVETTLIVQYRPTINAICRNRARLGAIGGYPNLEFILYNMVQARQ